MSGLHPGRVLLLAHYSREGLKAMNARSAARPHRIQIFTGGCGLCSETVDIIEIGKCKDCKMETLAVDDPKNRKAVKRYGVSAVPTVVIDGRIKVLGVPDFPWFCGDEFYGKLEREFPLAK